MIAMRNMFFFTLFVIFANGLYGQDSYDIYSDEGLTISTVSPLDFGSILQTEGERVISLGDPDMAVIEITGVEYLDIVVTLLPDNELLQADGPGTLPFTLQAAFANRGRDDIGDAVLIEGNQARFPILNNASGPSVQPQEGYNTPEATAFLYLYGSFNADSIPSGEYSGSVNIHVAYD